MSDPAFISIQSGVVSLHIKLQPRSSRNEVGPIMGNELKIKVTAPPVDAAANEALVKLLSERLDCSRSMLQIVRGRTSRRKTVSVRGMEPPAIVQRLLADFDGKQR
jgi:uncharacterized protein